VVDLALLDNIRHGARVISTDRKEVGEVYAVVLDPRDDEVSAIVVNAGPHFPAPGFGAPELICVPIHQVADAQENRVILTCTKKKFKELPSYVERSSVLTPGELRPAGHERREDLAWDAGAAIIAGLRPGAWGIAVPFETFRKAKFERHILNDAPVWRQEPHEKIGEVERILVNEVEGEIEALVIRKGFFFEDDVILPIAFVTELWTGWYAYSSPTTRLLGSRSSTRAGRSARSISRAGWSQAES
jgi:sporulation protein YlmC with PRC-barrel domain